MKYIENFCHFVSYSISFQFFVNMDHGTLVGDRGKYMKSVHFSEAFSFIVNHRHLFEIYILYFICIASKWWNLIKLNFQWKRQRLVAARQLITNNNCCVLCLRLCFYFCIFNHYYEASKMPNITVIWLTIYRNEWRKENT